MKKILSNVYMLAALFMIGAAITSCSKSDDTPAPEPKPVGPTTYTMTIKATKSADAKTRALTPDGSAINATWTENDEVKVYDYESETFLGTLKAQDLTNENTQCTLKGTLTQAPAGSSVTLKYQGNADYSSQGGTIAYISANCDYAKANVAVTVDGNRITGSGANFINQQAIVKFTLKEGEALISPGALKVHFSSTTEPANIVTVTLSDISSIYSTNGNGVVYVAIPGATYNVTLNATMENTFYTDTYSYTKTGATFANNYYAITVKMVKNFNPYKTPLTLECCDANGSAIIVGNIDGGGNGVGDLHYNKYDGEGWKPFSGINQINLTKGQKISFLGSENSRRDGYENGNLRFQSNGLCYIYGNIMSLIDDDINKFYKLQTLDQSKTHTFAEMFKHEPSTHDVLITHDNIYGRDLVLPATTLSEYCYFQMFYGCTNLDRAPELPATNLVAHCYEEMFYNCSSLDYIKCLATTNLNATNCTTNWVYNVAGSGKFVKASSTSWTTGDSGIPHGWTVEP